MLSILRHGYKLPFRGDAWPQAYREPNNKTALENMPYLQDNVETLLEDTTVSEVFAQPLCCSSLTVASHYVDSLLKLHTYIGLSRNINLLLKKESVSLPSLDKALKLLLPGDFQATFDLKSTFHHILIHPEHRQYLDIYHLSRSLLLDIIPIHVKRSDYQIVVADYGSRLYDPDDWACDDASFESLTRYWPATIDLFAHFSNAQLPRFYSYGNSPHTAGVDAFAQDWCDEIAWCCPPVSFVIPAFKKIAATRMQAILVVPAWKSAFFWTFPFPNGLHAVDICISISAFGPFIIQGRFCSNFLLQGNPAFPFLALYLCSAGLGYSGLKGSVPCPDVPYIARSMSLEYDE